MEEYHFFKYFTKVINIKYLYINVNIFTNHYKKKKKHK